MTPEACSFVKGLPLPFAGLFVCRGAAADVTAVSWVGFEEAAAAGELDAADADVSAELCVSPSVDVNIAPVLTPDGPTTIGTMTSSVWPLASVVVLVNVDE
jgi:hypothetical protein